VPDPSTARSSSTARGTSGTELGWTAGAGIETPVGDRWTVKAEYPHPELGTQSVTFDAVSPGLAYNF
jgi:opacity protein-like surface antigen